MQQDSFYSAAQREATNAHMTVTALHTFMSLTFVDIHVSRGIDLLSDIHVHVQVHSRTVSLNQNI